MEGKKLLTGVAYHGNRMPTHYRQDLENIVKADMDIVVHMLSHTDWERHKEVMKDIFAMTMDAGIDVWVDNWGIGGPPGDKSHFLAYYPDSHIYYSNGEMNPASACLNSPDYRRFVKEWIDTVAELGVKTIFWDEPYLPTKRKAPGSDERYYGCCCPRCRKIFEERYGKPMPEFADDDANRFRTDTIVDYLGEITDYSAERGIKNVVCVMLGQNLGISLDSIDRLCSLPHVDNIGSDPYWRGVKDVSPYEYVYKGTKKNLEVSEKFNKEHNLWIQAYGSPMGKEEEIIEAAAGAYDAGARTILAWAYMGSESNNYRAKNPLKSWSVTVEAFRRLKSMERDKILAENRAKYMK